MRSILLALTLCPAALVFARVPCPRSAGKFTVPSYILSGLPAGTGGAALQNSIHSTLSASGIDIGASLADISYSVRSTTK